MASPATNRMNAQNSTGPRSVEGKAVTRFNALRHGLDAFSLVIPGEDPAEFAELSCDLHNEYMPETAIEVELVETLTRSTWFQHRYARIEAQLFDTIFKKLDDPNATMADVFYHDAAGPNVMGKLFRRQQAARRDFDKALTELRRIQRDRVAAQMLRAAAAKPAPARSRPRLRLPPLRLSPTRNLSPVSRGLVPNPYPGVSSPQPKPVHRNRSLTTFPCS